MTSIEEIRELIASTVEISRQNSEAIRELQANQLEADKRWAEGQKRWDEDLAEIKRLREEMGEQREEMREELRTSREEMREEHRASRGEMGEQREEMREERLASRGEMREQREEMREELLASRREMREELLASRKESDRIWNAVYKELRGLRRDVGQLGNRLGLSTEAMFFPSLDRILRQDFGMQVVEPRVHVEAPDGEEIEIDVLAHANDALDLVFDVEIKTHMRQDGLDQILDHLQRLAKFFPEHRGKKAYGILGAIEMPAELKARALKAGIYVASIRDDVFELLRPEGFEPRAFPI